MMSLHVIYMRDLSLFRVYYIINDGLRQLCNRVKKVTETNSTPLWWTLSLFCCGIDILVHIVMLLYILTLRMHSTEIGINF